MKNYQVILIGGFGRSGTAAIHELLRSHKQIYALPGYEFRLLTDPDGLLSLKSAVVDNWNVFQADFALQRFIKLHRVLGSYWKAPYIGSNYSNHLGRTYSIALRKMISELNVGSYKGIWAAKNSFINKIILKITKHNKWYINNHIYSCPNISEEKFYEITTKFIQNMHLDKLKTSNKKAILLNEPNTSQNPVEALNLTSSKHLIIVYRDPRDSFASFLNKDWSPHRLDIAVEFLRLVFNRWIKQKEFLNKIFLLEIKLEDLVFDQDHTIKRIEDFLQIEISKDMIIKSNYSPKKAHVGRWKSEFCKSDKEKINNAFSEILSYFGYEK